jgi:iron complex outermembrane recepter protein
MKHLIFFIASFIIFISTPFSLFAQEKEVTLGKVVVTATRDEQEIRKIPANVTVITREEIEQSHARNTVDLLKNEADVVVRDVYGTGKTASVDIRGFGETGALNTLVLVDGRRVNAIDLSGVDWTQIPLDQIERIEIVRGSGSVLYGDNAVGGVINIITKKPEKPFSAKAEVAGGSYSYHKESGSVGGKWGPISAMLNAGYSSTDGYRDNGFLRAKDVGGKLIYDLNENISFNFSGSLHSDDSGLPGGLSKADITLLGRKSTTHPDDKAETDDEYGALGIKAKLWDLGRIEADVSFRTREVGVSYFYSDPFISSTYKERINLSTWGFTPKYVLEKSLFNHPNKFILGFDFYKSDSRVDSESYLSFPGIPGMTFTSFDKLEVTKKSFGSYLFDEFSILENLILSLGFREEWVIYDFLQDSSLLKDKLRDREPAWNIGLDYLFGKRSSAFFSIKRSFRFPASDELFQFYPTPKVNTSLKPQTGYHYEAGIRHVFTDQIEANLTLFWIDLKDEIFYNPKIFPEISANENFPKTRRRGFEVGAKAKLFPWLSVWGNYSYIIPTLRAEPFSGNDIPGVPRHKGSMGVDIDFGKGFLLKTKTNIVGSRRLISDWRNQLERLDGYYTLDTKLCYSWKGLQAFVGVNNLTNQKYVDWGVTNASGTSQLFYPSPERNFFGGVSYTF